MSRTLWRIFGKASKVSKGLQTLLLIYCPKETKKKQSRGKYFITAKLGGMTFTLFTKPWEICVRYNLVQIEMSHQSLTAHPYLPRNLCSVVEDEYILYTFFKDSNPQFTKNKDCVYELAIGGERKRKQTPYSDIIFWLKLNIPCKPCCRLTLQQRQTLPDMEKHGLKQKQSWYSCVYYYRETAFAHQFLWLPMAWAPHPPIDYRTTEFYLNPLSRPSEKFKGRIKMVYK